MTGNSGEHLAAGRVSMGRPGAVGAGRDRFGLTGTSQAYDRASPRSVPISPTLPSPGSILPRIMPHR